MNDRFTPTQYGFDWRPMRLTRCISEVEQESLSICEECGTEKNRYACDGIQGWSCDTCGWSDDD